MEANKSLAFKNITDFPRGTLAALLKDGYAFEPKFAQYWQTQWQTFDDFFYDNPRIAEKYGFVTVLDDKPIGLVSWDPRNLPESAEVGHNCIATNYKGNSYGTRQMREAVNRIIAQGANRIVVWTNERLTAAQRMYERVGFKYIAKSAEPICPECAGQRIHYELKIDRGAYKMNDTMRFANRESFRSWLSENCLASAGVWLLFSKAGGPKTLTATEALEEALCFGWIDGKMQSIDDKTYKKYFSARREKSKWSDKNKRLAQSLEARGLMTDFGRKKIEEAKQNGQWDAPDLMALTDEHIAVLSALLEGHEPAHANFQAMPQSVKKTYTRAYFDAKTAAGREKRLAWITDRLDKNLRPM